MSFSNRFFFVTLAGLSLLTGCNGSAQTVPVATVAPSPTMATTGARKLDWTVAQSFPHDPRAFTEGLLWYNGSLYEGTGEEGRSNIRKVNLITGQVEQQKDNADEIFGEGLARVNDRLYQLSWKNGLCFVYDLKTFTPKSRFVYKGEGWGLTYDGTDLIQSDGSAKLTFRDPVTFAPRRQVTVTWDGRPIDQINELEYINGLIWANVWQTDTILVIDPKTGIVRNYLDMTGLLPAEARKGGEDVLNGIAYDPAEKRIFVTGKNWPKLYWIEVK